MNTFLSQAVNWWNWHKQCFWSFFRFVEITISFWKFQCISFITLSLSVPSTFRFWQWFIDPHRSLCMCGHSQGPGSVAGKQKRDARKQLIVSGWKHLYSKLSEEWFPAKKTEQLLYSWLTLLRSHWFCRSNGVLLSFRCNMCTLQIHLLEMVRISLFSSPIHLQEGKRNEGFLNLWEISWVPFPQ